MIHNNKKLAIWQIALLCVCMLAISVGIAAPTISAATKTSSKTLLKNTIAYCGKLSESKYTAVSWKAFQKELSKAKTVYKQKNKKDDVYTNSLDKLEKAKANLMFIPSKEMGNPLHFRQLTVNQIVSEMGTGWNLGNTMDTGGELTLQKHKVTKAFIKAVHDAGFNTIRIPVTWGTYIDKNTFEIKDEWMTRVQDLVDYAISQDMYVIINLHHDGLDKTGWIDVDNEDIDGVYNKYEQVVRNIVSRFKDYDEHLIFESLNEVGSSATPQADTKVINNLNQIFVNVVRSTGSNNSERWMLVPGRFTNIDQLIGKQFGFELPKDTVKNRIFVSAHYYDFSFSINETLAASIWGANSFKTQVRTLESLADAFTKKGIPVIIGEYGAVNKNNPLDRTYFYEATARICRDNGMIAVAWDDGGFDPNNAADLSFTLFDKGTNKVIHPELVNAIMRGTFLPSTKKDYSDVVKDPKVTKITDFTLSNQTVTMSIEDSVKVTTSVTPSNTNDVVLWKTADPTIATVSNGTIRARGIGTTTITAFSQSETVTKNITVTVNAKKSSKPCTEIVTDSSALSLEKGKYTYLKASMKPADTDDFITYKSSDESVATVSTIGKVVGVGKGTTYITLTASNGLTKILKVTVTQAEVIVNKDMPVALHIAYSDEIHKYYSTLLSKPVQIDKNGQYTLTFDCSTELPEEATKLGVSTLDNLTCLYIRDVNYTNGKTTKSPAVSCDITYDKVIIDGVELTITKPGPKSALKTNGVFDSNDPFNSWNGSAVKEVKDDLKNHLFSFTTIKNPKKIEVIFTISNLVFDGEQKEDTTPVKTVDATSISADTSKTINLSNIGDTSNVSVNLAPVDTTSKVTFVSSNSSVVAVDSSAIAVDSKTGKATSTLTAMSSGTATITAYTSEGLLTTFEVKVGN